MDQFDKMLAKWQPTALSLFRFITGLLLFQYGVAKIFKFPVVPYVRQHPAVDRDGRHDRTRAWRAVDDRPVHAARRVHPVRRNGVRLFHRPHVQEARQSRSFSRCSMAARPRSCSASPVSTLRRRAAGRSASTRCGRSKLNPSFARAKRSDPCHHDIATELLRVRAPRSATATARAFSPPPSHRAAPPLHISNCAAPATSARCARGVLRSGA